MINKVLMPRMGSSMEQGTIINWIKHEGDRVEKGDMIAEIETEKVNIEIEAFASGTLRKIIVPEGQTVSVGALIAVIAGADEPLPPIEQLVGGEAGAPAQPTPQPEAVSVAPIAPSAPEGAPGRLHVSPVARRLAEEYHVDLMKVRGTGPSGRIVKADIESAAQRAVAQPAVPAAMPAKIEEVPLTRMRQAIGHQMTVSKQNVPHFYVTMEVDVAEAQRVRQALNDVAIDEADKVSVNDLVVAAVGRALRKYPQVNASLAGDSIQIKHFVNVGIAIAIEEGLVVPVVHDADKKTLREIARATKLLAEGAHKRLLTATDVSDATFTISNLGMLGAEEFFAIINPPESGILAVGAIEKKPVVVGDAIVIGQRMKITLSGDHRVIDGAVGARFLQEVKAQLEQPVGNLVL